VPTKLFSPVCRCPNRSARITIKLRHRDRATVTIVDAAGHKVAQIGTNDDLSARTPHVFAWNGHNAYRYGGSYHSGRAADGVYHPQVHLAHARHTYRFTNNIILDTVPPKVLAASTVKKTPVLFGGPGRSVAIRYLFDKPAHAAVYLGKRLIVFGHKTKQPGKVKWAGRVGGRPLPAGTYVLSVGGQDKAGNQTPVAKRRHVRVELRYVELSPGRLTVRAGLPLRVRVRTAASRYTWRLGKRHGTRRGRLLRLRAPTTPGTYRLVVSEDGQSTTAVVRVRAK
jgi:hypothetical protein